MGAENAVTKRYLSDPERFTEVFNNEVFQGKQVIQAQRLRELDTKELAEIVETHKELRFLERYRDCVKIHDQKVLLVILGIEQGMKALILDNLEEGKTREQIILKLEKLSL